MDVNLILIISISFIIAIILTYLITIWTANKKLEKYKSLSEAIKDSEKKIINLSHKIKAAKEIHNKVNTETKELQLLKNNADNIAATLKSDEIQLEQIKLEISTSEQQRDDNNIILQDLLSKLDLYTRIEDFADFGHFEMPDYMFQTSARFIEEIKRIRETQKELIKSKQAVTYPDSLIISQDKTHNKKILEGQIKLMLTGFNIECDLLISKVSPSNLPRTLERIEKLANNLEKSAATLHCGFNINYIEMKFEECRLQYQSALKKQEEKEEQRLIKEQIREEQKAIKEYERAIAQAEKEERMYRDMLAKAKEELYKASDDERLITEQKIAALEKKLAEAEAKEERAKSMAEQTRKGHVYIISNIGSFGEGIYKIGLTRRLEPMDRVKELGDASVPFTFDVHAMIYVEDAPKLEKLLHHKFTTSRVNAVNMRKEFFRVELDSIKSAVEELVEIEADFKMTAVAEEYFESRRLLTQTII